MTAPSPSSSLSSPPPMASMMGRSCSYGFQFRSLLPPFPSPFLSRYSASSTGLTPFFSSRLSFSHCRSNRLRLITASPLASCESRLFIHCLSSQEGNGCSNAATGPSTRQRKQKTKDMKQSELVSSSEEASLSALPKKVTARASRKKKETSFAETEVAFTSDEASLVPSNSTSGRKVTRRRKKDDTLPLQSVPSVHDQLSGHAPTSENIPVSDDTPSKRVNRRKKVDKSFENTVSEGQHELERTSMLASTTRRKTRGKKESDKTCLSVNEDEPFTSHRKHYNDENEVPISTLGGEISPTSPRMIHNNLSSQDTVSSQNDLPNVLMKASPKKISKTKNDDDSVNISNKLSSILEESSQSLPKKSSKKENVNSKMLSSHLPEPDIFGDDVSERSLAVTTKTNVTSENLSSGYASVSKRRIKKRKDDSISAQSSMEENILESSGPISEAEGHPISSLKLSKKVSMKKKKQEKILEEFASSAACDLSGNENVSFSIEAECTSSVKGAQEMVEHIPLSKIHLSMSTIPEGNESKVGNEDLDAHRPKITVKSHLRKETVESNEQYSLASPNQEGSNTAFKMTSDISSISSANEPLENKFKIPDFFMEDDFIFSEAMYSAHEGAVHQKRSNNLAEPKNNRSLEREVDKDNRDAWKTVNGMAWRKNVEPQRAKRLLEEDHITTTPTNDNSLQFKRNNPSSGRRLNDPKSRFDIASDTTEMLASKCLLPLRKENLRIQPGMAKHIRKILEKQNDKMPQTDRKFLPKTGNVKVRTHGKFWDQNSKQFSDQKGRGAMHPQKIEKTERFKNVDRHLEGTQYLVNTSRAHGMDRKERKQFAVRDVLANQASTLSYMQIYGTGFDTGDTMPTVLLFFDRRRFIFNVGEGLLRFCMEHRFKMSKIDHVFLTRVCSETTGGLPGLILTLAELGESGLAAQTWGPSNLQDLGKALCTFVPSAWLEHAHCFGPANHEVPDHPSVISLMEDELLKISAVLLYREDQCSRTASVLGGSSELEHEKRFRYDLPSTVYICELSEVKGKFDPAKALEKGLKPGYKYGKLQKGESVMSDDGRTMVHPDDVLGPSNPGPIMFIVDCPSLSYLPSLLSARSIQSFFSGSGKVVNCMVHVSPPSVTRSKEYQCWMKNFSEAHHIMAYEQSASIGKPTLRCSTSTLSKLNFICPQLFPLIWPESEMPESQGFENEDKNIYVADNLLKFRFRPLANLGLDLSDVPRTFDHSPPRSVEMMKARDISKEVFENWYNSNASLGIPRKKGYVNSEKIPSCLKGISREEMELVFLGTGSSQPSRHRNVTSIYIHLFKYGGILLDCGEGTYAQLKRRYGHKGADEVLMGLKLIWISHMHADHFTGLVRVLTARRELVEETGLPCEHILVIGPKQLKVFLNAYGAIEDLRMNFLDCSQTTFDVENYSTHKIKGLISAPSEKVHLKSQMQHYWMHPGFHIHQGIDTEGRKKLRKVLSSLGLKNLFSIPVVHCPNAFAVVIEADQQNRTERETGWKLVFSGDTRPCRALVEAARGATILIHEATFDDGLLPEAVKKNHSITKEAIEVGVAAEVYRIFLTHFSQRYPAVPVFDNSYNDRTCIAFDMMTVNLADLPVVPQLLPAFKLLFSLQPEDEDVAINV